MISSIIPYQLNNNHTPYSQNEEPPDINPDESDDGGELDEITAVQSQPLEEETIVNPNFIHHYMSRTSGRGGNGFSS